MEKIERVLIIVDGSNFYHRLKETSLTRLLAFDYGRFGQFLAGRRMVHAKRYYIGAIREERGNAKSTALMRGQQKLVSRLQKAGWEVQFGHMLKTDGYHEKGVDVLMAVDLLAGAYEDQYDTAILVSSDTDLIPALIKVRDMKKKVEYIGFSHKPSLGLITNSDIRRLLTADDLAQFIAEDEAQASQGPIA
ncbi:MAG: NYN domain-containing protein [Patescibacteria group bacterium]